MKHTSLSNFFVAFIFSMALIIPSFVSSTAEASKSAVTEEEAKVLLQEFAVKALESMNRLVIPSKTKKEIKQNADGTWTARYTEVDLSSVTTSVKVPEDTRYVQYVGYMRYVDTEFVSTASSKEDALAGPFAPKGREGLTELVKFMKGKWGY